jgi:hypothetical protein
MYGKMEKFRFASLLLTKITIQLAALLACCFRISVPELFPDMHWYEARQGNPQTCPKGDLMQMMSMKKHRLHFRLSFP